ITPTLQATRPHKNESGDKSPHSRLPVLVAYHDVRPRHSREGVEAAFEDQVGQLAHVAEIALAGPLAGELAAQVLAENVGGCNRRLVALSCRQGGYEDHYHVLHALGKFGHAALAVRQLELVFAHDAAQLDRR